MMHLDKSGCLHGYPSETADGVVPEGDRLFCLLKNYVERKDAR
jgi:hypothetical protein